MTDQWTLNRRNFAGHWQGCGSWFERDGSGRLDLQHPTRRIDPTTYAISFSDDDHGVWDGSGLAFAPGVRPPIPSAGPPTTPAEAAGSSLGAGGQSSRGWMPSVPASAMRSTCSAVVPARCWCCSGNRLTAAGVCSVLGRWFPLLEQHRSRTRPSRMRDTEPCWRRCRDGVASGRCSSRRRG